MANLDHVTYTDVEEAVGKEKAPAAWQSICRAGGFGNISPTADSAITFAGADEKTLQEAAGILAGDDSQPAADDLTRLSRTKLETMAQELGLDGNTYTNKQELAEAIVAKQAENAGE